MKLIVEPKPITKENFSKFGDMITTKNIKPLEIINPQGIELSNLRVSLLPGMLDIVAFNTNRQNNKTNAHK